MKILVRKILKSKILSSRRRRLLGITECFERERGASTGRAGRTGVNSGVEGETGAGGQRNKGRKRRKTANSNSSFERPDSRRQPEETE